MRYHFTCMYKQAAGVKMHIALVDSAGIKLGDEVTLTPKQGVLNGLRIP
jgi:hypothetical protein